MKKYNLLKRVTQLTCLALSISCLTSTPVVAKTFNLPPAGQAIIGALNQTPATTSDTPATIGHRYNLGQNAVIAANPGLAENTTLSASRVIQVPTEFLLPPLPHKGIIINLPEMRLYYYPNGTDTVMTFPIGIGKIGKTIPIANTAITRKVVNPTWTPPEDIREFNRKQGVILPARMGPGPDNPLGPYAIYLTIPTYLIHSTIFPESVGRRASFGCIRMNEDDIKQFYPLVTAGTPVTIVDMPNKVAWSGNTLYLESHAPLEERSTLPHATLSGVVQAVENATQHDKTVIVNWQLVSYLADHPDGIPHEIGVRVN